jgi:hypothetical protein
VCSGREGLNYGMARDKMLLTTIESHPMKSNEIEPLHTWPLIIGLSRLLDWWLR